MCERASEQGGSEEGKERESEERQMREVRGGVWREIDSALFGSY